MYTRMHAETQQQQRTERRANSITSANGNAPLAGQQQQRSSAYSLHGAYIPYHNDPPYNNVSHLMIRAADLNSESSSNNNKIDNSKYRLEATLCCAVLCNRTLLGRTDALVEFIMMRAA